MTDNAIITVLMALGMSYDDADSALDMYCTFCCGLPNGIADIKAIWWLYSETEIRNKIEYNQFYFPGEL